MEIPPPPPPKKKTGLIIGIAAAVVVCLCLVIIAVVAAVVWLDPGMSLRLQGTAYSNYNMGLSMYYPNGWVMDEGYDAVTFASSQDALDNGPTSGAGFAVVYSQRSDLNVPPSVDPESPEDILNYLISDEFEGIQIVQPASSSKIGGLPAASMIISISGVDYETTIQIQMTIVVASDAYYIAYGACPQDMWDQYAPTFKGMLKTIKITSP